jgi:hypothetical protein
VSYRYRPTCGNAEVVTSRNAPLADQRRGTARAHPVRCSAQRIDVPLVAYGLATGILAVGAGTLVTHAHRYIGSLTEATAVLATLTVAVLSSLASDAVLGWLLPLRRMNSSRHS